MARKLQKLINYHSSGTTKLTNEYSSVDFGELVVMHNSELPLLGIKTNGTGGEANGFAWFIHSGAVVDAINSLSTEKISTLENNLNTVSGNLVTLSGKVVDDYATSANTVAAINSVSGNVKTLTDNFNAVSATVNSISGIVNSVSGQVTTNTTNINNLDGRVTSLEAESDLLSGAVKTVSGAVITLSGDLITEFNQKISTVYRVKGSVTEYSDLANVTNPVAGDVYNVVNSQGTPGQSTYVPAGTNYVYVTDQYGENPHWDPLGGSIDLSPYALSANVKTLTDNLDTRVGALETFSGYVETHYATSADTVAAIEAANGDVSALSGSVVNHISTFNTFSGYVETHYATSADTVGAINAVNTKANKNADDISNLSAATVSIETTANGAVQDAKFGTVSSATGEYTQSGAKIETTNNNIVLDLNSLVIDCGDF